MRHAADVTSRSAQYLSSCSCEQLHIVLCITHSTSDEGTRLPWLHASSAASQHVQGNWLMLPTAAEVPAAAAPACCSAMYSSSAAILSARLAVMQVGTGKC
jgi:hypothetical protein